MKKSRSSSQDLGIEEINKRAISDEKRKEGKSLLKKKNAVTDFSVLIENANIFDNEFASKVLYAASIVQTSFEKFDETVENQKDLSIF